MTAASVIETARLRLRPFMPDDAGVHERLYADPEVTRWLGGGPFLGAQASARSAAALTRFVAHWRDRGFGVWAVLDRASGRFLGQCGLNTVTELAEVEVLYALERSAWGRGLATEAAAAALAYGFGHAGLGRIIALARPDNIASRRVMDKLGLLYERDLVIWEMAAVLYGVAREEFARKRS